MPATATLAHPCTLLHGQGRQAPVHCTNHAVCSTPERTKEHHVTNVISGPIKPHVQAQAVEALLASGADLHAAATDDTNSLHFAAQKGHLDVAKLLLAKGSLQ